MRYLSLMKKFNLNSNDFATCSIYESSETILEKKRSTRYSENSDGGSSDSSGLDAGDEFQTKLNNLMEMFPDSCTLEVSHCLNLMAGDIEEAVQLIIHRQENGQSLQPKKV